MRNPGFIFSARQDRKKRSEDEVRRQFEDEKKVFSDMFRWRDRLENIPTEQKKEGEQQNGIVILTHMIIKKR